MFVAAFAAAAALLAADPSSATATASAGTTAAVAPAPVAAAAAPAAKKVVNPDDVVVCKDQDVLGSRLGGTRVCHTRREWRAITQESQDVTRGATGSHQTGTGLNGG